MRKGPNPLPILTLETHSVNFADPALIDEYRPTAGPEFTPSADDECEAAIVLNAACLDYWTPASPDLLERSTVDDLDYRAERAYQADRVAAGPLF
jgi:hypothetical protein